MARKIYTDKHIGYLRQIAPGRYGDEITKLFNQKFGTNLTRSAIRSVMTRKGIRSDVPRRKCWYTDEMLDCLRELSAQGLFNDEIARRFNERFDTNKTETAIQLTRSRNGLQTSARNWYQEGHPPWNKGMKGWRAPGAERTWFKKGHMPANHVPVGTEVVDGDGYVKVKIAEPKTWKHKHRLIWERRHGRSVPPGHVVIFGDGDKRNFNPDNLILVSRRQLAVLNKKGLIRNDADLTRTGIMIADLTMKITEKK